LTWIVSLLLSKVLDNLSLSGVPVVVGSDPKEGVGRGVVSTCSYEARAHGVRSGMPISKAFRLLSGTDAVFLPVRMSRYKEVSDRVMGVLRGYADMFEQVSIDEAFLDVTERVRDWSGVEEFADMIKQDVLEGVGLTCSVGCAPNKSASLL